MKHRIAMSGRKGRGLPVPTRLRLLGAVCLAGGLAAVPAAASAASTARIAILSFASSASNVLPQGGAITLSGVVSNGGSCTLKVTPILAGFPRTFDCTAAAGKSKRSFHATILMPQDAASQPVHYSWTLVATPKGSSASVKKSLVVTVDAFSLHSSTKTQHLNMSPLALSCSGPAFCMAVGKAGDVAIRSAVSGNYVVKALVQQTSALTGVSCASPKMCAVIDDTGDYFFWDGAKMSGANPLYDAGSTTKASLTSVSCPTVSFCMVIDKKGDAVALSKGKPPRQLVPVATAGLIQAGVSCASATSCDVVDLNGDGYAWNGKTWTSPSILIPAGGVRSIACPPGGSCFVVDNGGHAFTITNPGPSGTWDVTTSVAKASGALIRVRCADAVFCLVEDKSGGVYRLVKGLLGGRVLVFGGLADLSCTSGGSPSVRTCAAVTVNGAKELSAHVLVLK